ncbi:MAG: helix-turn-helix domain-containing protein [Pseudomonadota bacterium]
MAQCISGSNQADPKRIHIPQNTEQHAFRALADPTRCDLLTLLSRKAMTVAEGAARFNMTRPARKEHLTALGDGGLITVPTHPRRPTIQSQIRH